MEIVVARPVILIGPGDARPNFMGSKILHHVNGLLPFFSPVNLNLIDVRDAAKIICGLVSAGKSGCSYLLVSSCVGSAEFLEVLARCCGASRRWRPVSPRVASIFCALVEAYCQVAKQESPWPTPGELDFLARTPRFDPDRELYQFIDRFTSFPDTLKDELAWFEENGFIAGQKNGVTARRKKERTMMNEQTDPTAPKRGTSVKATERTVPPESRTVISELI